MQTPNTYEYAILRVVPRVERGEFVNVGVLMSCSATRFLKAKIEINEARILALDPRADLETIRGTLAAIPIICAGGAAAGDLGKLTLRERFHWLVAPRSSSVQTSPVHTGRCQDLEASLSQIFNTMVQTL